MSDNFSYTYNGNQLTSLSSASGSYLYDNNGNMTKDPRKNLELSYNSLNLLSEVRQSSGIKAKYVYAADGTKLAVADVGGNGYDYRGSLIYKNTSGTKSLESVAFSDGRITKTNSTYVPNYYLTDHLGSVRVIFDASGTVLEQNDYYAFGEKHQNSSLLASNNRFKYNGKELQTTGDLGLLDYGARMYDAKLGRTHSQDLLQEDYYGISSYAYCFNDPVRYVDMLGLYPDDRIGDIGTVNIDGGRGNDYNWFSAWIRQVAALRDRDVEKAKQHAFEANRLINERLNGILSKQAHHNYLKDGDLSSYLKFIGHEISGQWMNPEMVVGGLSMGIAGLQVVNSPLKSGAIQTPKIGKGASGAVKSKIIQSSKEKILNGKYTITKTVAKNLKNRPYINSPSTIVDIMETGVGVPDLSYPGGINFKVIGTFGGRQGIFELGINPKTNTIYHFLHKPNK